MHYIGVTHSFLYILLWYCPIIKKDFKKNHLIRFPEQINQGFMGKLSQTWCISRQCVFYSKIGLHQTFTNMQNQKKISVTDHQKSWWHTYTNIHTQVFFQAHFYKRQNSMNIRRKYFLVIWRRYISKHFLLSAYQEATPQSLWTM